MEEYLQQYKQDILLEYAKDNGEVDCLSPFESWLLNKLADSNKELIAEVYYQNQWHYSLEHEKQLAQLDRTYDRMV